MSQLWTISLIATGEVLCPAFDDAGTGLHPKDKGWPWDAATQVATPIDAIPNTDLKIWNEEAWVANMPALRDQAWAAVKSARDAAEWSGCATALGRVDTDADSQRKISGAVQMAMIAQAAGEAFALDWTMQDNSVVAHDGPAMISLGVVVGQHVAACHAVATIKRAAIAAAGDVQDLEAIDIAAGWPGDSE